MPDLKEISKNMHDDPFQNDHDLGLRVKSCFEHIKHLEEIRDKIHTLNFKELPQIKRLGWLNSKNTTCFSTYYSLKTYTI